MSLQERIEGLRARHQELEAALKDANAHYTNNIEIHQIKKQKLAIKDEIAQLENQLQILPRQFSVGQGPAKSRKDKLLGFQLGSVKYCNSRVHCQFFVEIEISVATKLEMDVTSSALAQ